MKLSPMMCRTDSHIKDMIIDSSIPSSIRYLLVYVKLTVSVLDDLHIIDTRSIEEDGNSIYRR